MSETRDAVVSRLDTYERVVEIGIGRRQDVARALAERGGKVTATDIVDCDVPDSVGFARDDITDPDPNLYSESDAVYGLNLPPELHRPAFEVATDVDADFLFTTLGGDQPVVPVEREMLPGGETLFVARDDVPGGRRD